MTVKFVLGAAAIVGALSLGVPAMAADNGDMKPMVHHRHHHAMHHTMHHEMPMHHTAAHHRMHNADMGVEARERAETEKLNRDQLH